MTKLLYIPSGDFIIFWSKIGDALTYVYEESEWPNSINYTINYICSGYSVSPCQLNPCLTLGMKYSIAEFEVIYD